jgi:hypothetical protein
MTRDNENNMGGKTALITGASSGIGAEFARQLAACGMNLVLVARREDRLAALSDELQQEHGIDAEVLVADLNRTEDVQRVEQRIAELDDFEMLINSAGFGLQGSFSEVDVQGQIDMIRVHVEATVRLTRAAVPTMIRRDRGAIINVSSVAAYITSGESNTYCATKTYLNSFSESLQHELRKTKVRVQALCPGFTHTGFHNSESIGEFDTLSVPKWAWMSAEQVVSASLKALRRKRVIVVPGWKNWLLVFGLARPMIRPFLLPMIRGKN